MPQPPPTRGGGVIEANILQGICVTIYQGGHSIKTSSIGRLAFHAFGQGRPGQLFSRCTPRPLRQGQPAQ